MSKKYNPTNPAFPVVVGAVNAEVDPGMDLRTYLAGQALAGYMATVQARADTAFLIDEHGQALGQMCVRVADAVLAELNAEQVTAKPAAKTKAPAPTPAPAPVEEAGPFPEES